MLATRLLVMALAAEVSATQIAPDKPAQPAPTAIRS
jgi:hypothetical protein